MFVDGPVGLAARRLSIIDLETGDQPIANEDGTRRRRAERRDLQLRELTRELVRAATASARTATPRCSSTRTRSGARGFAERLRGMFAVAIWDARARRLVLARDRFGIKPLYYRVDGDALDVRVRAARAAARRDRPRRARGVPRVQLACPAPLSIFREHAQAAAGARPRLGGRDASSSQRYARPAPPLETRERRRGGARRGAARAAARLRARAPRRATCRSACSSRAASTRARSPRSPREETTEPLRTFSIGFEERSFDELADARLVAERYGTEHRELVLRPGRGAAPARARGRVRRAVRRLVGAADVPRLAARGRGREGRALGRGRRRALRRLLHVRRRPARASASAPAALIRGRSSSGCRRRRARRASTTARSASSARRTCRRSSGTTGGRRSSPPTRAPS